MPFSEDEWDLQRFENEGGPVLSVDGELSSVQTMVKPDINQIVEQVVAPWREHEPDILWHLVSALIVEVVSNHPEVILLSNMQAQRLLAELQQELPPNASIMDVAQWVNPGIIAVRKKVREA